MTGLIGGDRAGLICDGKDDTSLYNTPVMKKFAGIMLPVILILIIDVLPPFQTVTHEDGTGSVAMLARQLSYSDHNPNTLAGSDYGRQWAVSAIMATLAWQKTSGIPDVYIAVLDTGIDEMHEDVAGQVIDRANFTDSSTTADIYGHGTHVAGIIAAAHNNLGIDGMASGCRLLNVKVADDGGWCDSASIAKGIRWAVDRGAKVINISLYTLKPSQELEESVNYAWSKGAVVVAPSGNGIGSEIVYPAYYVNCIAVAATNVNDMVTSWSGDEEWVDIAAPGKDIFSTIPHNTYQYKSGTSMASAYVSGLAGLLFSMSSTPDYSNLSNDRVRSAIETSCDATNVSTTGRINAEKAIDALSASLEW